MITVEELLKPQLSSQVCPFRQGVHQSRQSRSEHLRCRSHRYREDGGDACTKRTVLLGSCAATLASLITPAATAEEDSISQPDTTITHKVYLDVGLCQQNKQNRSLGENAFCSQPEQLGRIVVGLYGNLVPSTVQNFLELIRSGNYENTLFNKVLPGEYISAGKQGVARMGEVALSTQLQPNRDLMSSKAYSLGHRRAGTVSLNLSHSEDDSFLQQSKAYRNVSFLITTGPGPADSLDGTNVVFGRVLQGMDTVGRVTAVPTFKPVNDRLLALNRLGSMLGDDRAEKTRRKWGRPLKPILITGTGVLT